MQYPDETRRRQLQLRVQEELAQARADLERTNRSPANGPDLGDRLGEIERALTRLQQSRSPLFRGRRRREVLGLLLSERLLLDDLGVESYADYLGEGVQAGSLGPDDDAASANLARLELVLEQARLTDIENGVLDLDWLEGGAPELSMFDRPEAGAALSAVRGGTSAAGGAPLEAWTNPFAVQVEPASTTGTSSGLPRLDLDGSPPIELPYTNEDESA